ncbi:14633_t:CDS:2, partial [Acaulospora colombiana]
SNNVDMICGCIETGSDWHNAWYSTRKTSFTSEEDSLNFLSLREGCLMSAKTSSLMGELRVESGEDCEELEEPRIDRRSRAELKISCNELMPSKGGSEELESGMVGNRFRWEAGKSFLVPVSLVAVHCSSWHASGQHLMDASDASIKRQLLEIQDALLDAYGKGPEELLVFLKTWTDLKDRLIAAASAKLLSTETLQLAAD